MILVARLAHHFDLAEIAQRRNQRSRKAPKKRLAVLAFNKGKGGIDLSASYCTTLKKGVKWYWKLATEPLLGMAVVNAWFACNEVTKKRSKFPGSRLAEQLLNLESVVHVTRTGSSSSHHLVERTWKSWKKIRRTCLSCCAKMEKQEGTTLERWHKIICVLWFVSCATADVFEMLQWSPSANINTRDFHFLLYFFQTQLKRSSVITTFLPICWNQSYQMISQRPR